MGKSASKIRRNQARAVARGETYTPPPPKRNDKPSDNGDDTLIRAKSEAAEKLLQKLAELESNPDNLNSKDRRSAKRKAEVIASEEAGCSAEELIEWYGQYSKKHKSNSVSQEEKTKLTAAKKLKESLDKIESDTTMNAKERRSAKRRCEAIATEETGWECNQLLQWYETCHPTKDKNKKHTTPYILFVGQLAYTTTSDMLFTHFQSTLGEIITTESMKIRLLTDIKTKKSKGMAFVELSTPEILYECLKMHLTHLDGRRINVERSSGGGSSSKKAKISHYREKQSSYISDTMDKIIATYIASGDIGQEELDDGVIALCKRHSAVVVEQALREYVEEKRVRRERKEKLGEKEEEELRNPSAFLTHMIGRVAEEGMDDAGKSRGDQGRVRRPDRSGRDNQRIKEETREWSSKGSRSDSVLEKSGVDMSISHTKEHKGNNSIVSIFPSMQRGRGRGRGRGYM
jgi:RNA recognition motif-containing protein